MTLDKNTNVFFSEMNYALQYVTHVNITTSRFLDICRVPVSDWFRAVRGMETLGLIFLVTSAALVLLSVCGKEQQPRLRKMASSILMAVSGKIFQINFIAPLSQYKELNLSVF